MKGGLADQVNFFPILDSQKINLRKGTLFILSFYKVTNKLKDETKYNRTGKRFSYILPEWICRKYPDLFSERN